MNRELEALIVAYEAVQEDVEDARRAEIFQSRVDDVVARTGLSREKIISLVHLQHARWLRAQQKTATIPPKA